MYIYVRVFWINIIDITFELNQYIYDRYRELNVYACTLYMCARRSYICIYICTIYIARASYRHACILLQN